MRLDLSDDESSELDRALSQQLHTLRMELAAADDRKFKADLRRRLEQLEGIAARVKATTNSAAPSPRTVDSRRPERLAQPEEAEAEAEELLLGGSTSPEHRAEATAANPDTAEAEAYRLQASSPPQTDEERPSSEVKKNG